MNGVPDWAALVLLTLLVGGCSVGRNIAGPSAEDATIDAGRATVTVAMAKPAGLREGATPAAVGFPPRDEALEFRIQLEAKYRDGLRRDASSSFVDLEGDIVWTQEYLRYRVNGCGHGDALSRVFDQIDGQGIAPVCGTASGVEIVMGTRSSLARSASRARALALGAGAGCDGCVLCSASIRFCSSAYSPLPCFCRPSA